MGDIITTWNSVNPDQKINSAALKKEYIVEPWTDDSPGASEDNLIPQEPISPALAGQAKIRSANVSQKSIHYITKGQTIVHSVNVSSGANYLEVDLNWGDKSDNLKLSTYNPSGKNLGAYRDKSDGSVNGRIHLSISPSNGQIQQGKWQFKVYGEAVSGKEGYTFNVYQH
ncbi:pre-peptidase C-terminal domain-containing protein [Methanosarcina sp.]|uniref:pre-peptidase C-terminal domain-containing protein n=1 Tax=Methanosarcina sp. TaxID=2213 RepID=UPI003C70F0A8